MVRHDPLNNRWKKQIKAELGKYLTIFLLLSTTIGLVSGFIVADSSMMSAYNESFEKYTVENGKFISAHRLNKAQIRNVESGSIAVKVYENFYVDATLDNGSTLRIFADRTEVDRVCLMSGHMPSRSGEIAVDRMYAVNNDLTIGDVLVSNGKQWEITGLVALPDYSCLFEDNNDTMFDSIRFGVAIVAAEEFSKFDNTSLVFNYAWRYVDQPDSEIAEKDMSEAFMDDLSEETVLVNFVPRFQNQAIIFTGDDMGSDKAMMEMLLYILMTIMAFVFGLTISDTITKESTVIGTLRAMGYTENELIRHYMTLPVGVTIIAALVGNIGGYTFFKDMCADLYYASYSLTTYTTIWSLEAFVKTSCIPFLIMAAVTYVILRSKMSYPIISFMHRDLKKTRKKKTMRLNKRIPFLDRFRIRIILQNRWNYLMLAVGLTFANLLLLFGLALPQVLQHFQTTITENMLAEYQTILKMPSFGSSSSKISEWVETLLYINAVESEQEGAEKFMAYSLYTPENTMMVSESVMLYGIQEDSSYIHHTLQKEDVFISALMADKYEMGAGDEITLHERFTDDSYTLHITGVLDYEGSISIFMRQEDLNAMLGYDESMFAGYFSNAPITDIDERYIANVIDADALTKVSRQLQVSMGSMMTILDGFCVVLFIILIYLLSKIIIEKNIQSISMTKILGYSDMEISGLYIRATTILIFVILLISIPLVYKVLEIIYKIMMKMMLPGWLPLEVDGSLFVKMYAIGVVSYMVVALLEYRKIMAIPMDEALKNVE